MSAEDDCAQECMDLQDAAWEMWPPMREQLALFAPEDREKATFTAGVACAYMLMTGHDESNSELLPAMPGQELPS